MDGMISFIIGFLGIALMVTVHETGHFLAARAVGITVETFAIGWGKALKRWYKGEVEYRINIFPLGGYCKLKGSEDLKRSIDSGDGQFKQVEPGSLFAVSPARRILTYLAGPIFNLLFAALIFIPYFALDYEAVAYPNRIVLTSDYPTTFQTDVGAKHAARDGGMLTGDTIIRIGNTAVRNFSDIQEALAIQEAGNPTRFLVQRGAQEVELQITGIINEETGKPFFGISFYLEPIVGSIDPLSPEAIAGLSPGDRILSTQGHTVGNTMALLERLADNPTVISLEVVQQDGTQKSITYSPSRGTDGNALFGFTFARSTEHRAGLGLIASVTAALKETVISVIDTITLIPRMFSSAYTLDDVVAGPVRISYVIGEMRNAGLRAVLHLMAMVSISLATANLLPIPGLDGGSILLSIVEMIRGKSVSPRMYVRFQSVGVMLLLFLMLFVIAGDIRFLFSGP